MNKGFVDATKTGSDPCVAVPTAPTWGGGTAARPWREAAGESRPSGGRHLVRRRGPWSLGLFTDP